MKDHVVVRAARTNNGPWRYWFECAHCDCQYETNARWRIVLSCRVHKFVCRGYRFPGAVKDI